jgi:hypothetical protein
VRLHAEAAGQAARRLRRDAPPTLATYGAAVSRSLNATSRIDRAHCPSPARGRTGRRAEGVPLKPFVEKVVTGCVGCLDGGADLSFERLLCDASRSLISYVNAEGDDVLCIFPPEEQQRCLS